MYRTERLAATIVIVRNDNFFTTPVQFLRDYVAPVPFRDSVMTSVSALLHESRSVYDEPFRAVWVSDGRSDCDP